MKINRHTFLMTITSSQLITNLLDSEIIEKVQQKEQEKSPTELSLTGICGDIVDASIAVYLTHFKFFLDSLTKCNKELLNYLGELEKSLKIQASQKALQGDFRKEEVKANQVAGKDKGQAGTDQKHSRWKSLKEAGNEVQKFIWK